MLIKKKVNMYKSLADPGFPVGGRGPRGGRGLPRQLRFENFVCRNKRIWALIQYGPLGGRVRRARPLPRSANANYVHKHDQAG